MNLKKGPGHISFSNRKQKKKDGMKSEQIKTVLLFFLKKRLVRRYFSSTLVAYIFLIYLPSSTFNICVIYHHKECVGH